MAPLGGQLRVGVGVANRNPLHHRRLRLCDESVFECQHAHVGTEDFEQLARSQQVIGIGRPAKGGVACRESLVDQQAAGSERTFERRKERPVQVVRDNDRVELPISEWPGSSFQIGLNELTFGSLANPCAANDHDPPR